MDQNTSSRTLKLIWIYRFLGVLGLVLCWRENLSYAHLDFFQGLFTFVKDLFVTPASRSFTFDIVVVFFAAIIFIYRETKRLKMPYFWFYSIGALVLALSFTFPLFLAEREKALSRQIKN